MLVTISGLIAASVFANIWIHNDYQKKVDAGLEFLPGDVHFTRKRCAALSVFILSAGTIAGFMGIDGMVFGKRRWKGGCMELWVVYLDASW